MFNYNPYVMSSIPFSLPGASIASATKNTFSFSSIFNGIQKTATTINQIVPLYHNVKPIITNSKTLFNIMKGVASTPSKSTKTEEPKKQNVIDVEVQEQNNEKTEIKSTTSPSKPFFS